MSMTHKGLQNFAMTNKDLSQILTDNNMIKRNGPYNHNCAQCFYIHETTEHFLTYCNFTEAAWNLVEASSPSQIAMPCELLEVRFIGSGS
jgi:hypothetical protein